MAFNGTEGNPIDHSIASEWTKNYREASPGKLIAHFFGRDVLLNILAQENCQGIRFYYGLDGEVQQILAVGADNEENDQLDGNSIVADESTDSPPRSGQDNILNS
jgi:hypothetical protein